MASETRQLDIILKLRDDASKQLGRFSGELGMLEKASSAAKTAIMGIGAGLVGMGVFAVKSAADMEKMRVSLDTSFKGNAEEAKKAFDTINEFTAKTPFQLEEVMTGFIKLKNMGLDPSKRALTSYGDTASAMGKSLNMMVEAVADAATGEFERLKEFGIKASQEGDKVTFTFRGVKTTVKKDAKEIEKYLIGLGETEFAGGMEKQSKTLYGIISTLKDQITLTMASVAEESGALEIVKKIVNDLATAIDNNKGKVIAWIKGWVESMGGKEGIQQKLTDLWNKIVNEVIPAIMTFIDVVKDITKFVWEHREAIIITVLAWEALKLALSIVGTVQAIATAISLLSSGSLAPMIALLTGPVGLIALFGVLATVAIVGAINAFYDLKTAQDNARDSADRVRDGLAKAQEGFDSLSTESAKQQFIEASKEAEKLADEAERLANLGFFGSIWEGIKSSNKDFGKKIGVNDAIISPKGDIITTHPDDFLIATKNPAALAGGGGGVNVVINYPFVLDRNGGDMLADVISQSLRNKLRI